MSGVLAGLIGSFRPAVGEFVLLEQQVLGSTTASVTFSNLATYASTYKHLQIRAVARSSNASTRTELAIRLNGDTGNNYAGHSVYGFSGSVLSGWEANVSRMIVGFLPAANATSGMFAPAVIDLLDPYASKNKTLRSLNGVQVDGLVILASGAWFNTASLTSITALPLAGSFVTGSRFSLYGVKG